MQMKANRKRNEVKLTASKPNRANRNQTVDWRRNNHLTALFALVHYMKLNITNVG